MRAASDQAVGKVVGGEGGYTLAELLVGTFIALTVLMVVFSAVARQGRSAAYLSGLADAQTTSRGAGQVLAEDLRMAGYGMLGVSDTAGVPPVSVAVAGGITTITLRGNYSNVSTTLKIAAAAGSSTITTNAPATGSFVVGNLVLVDSGLNSEVKTITSVSAAGGGGLSIGLNSSLVNAYPLGPDVIQIEVVTYTLQGTVLKRNNQVVADNVTNFQLQYIDQSGNVTSTPGTTLRSGTLNLVAAQPTQLPDNPTASSTVATEINMRNLAFRLTTS
ncbi:MAG TPA: hypothetical protein VEI94_01450 [Candidatus Bathyarchaeia archaeon]|nr:hypothetical protein [Candidatus Bathyarchaeia archaeon]